MVNQKVIIEVASVIYAIATYLVLKDNLRGFLKDKNEEEESSKAIKNEELDGELTDNVEEK